MAGGQPTLADPMKLSQDENIVIVEEGWADDLPTPAPSLAAAIGWETAPAFFSSCRQPEAMSPCGLGELPEWLLPQPPATSDLARGPFRSCSSPGGSPDKKRMFQQFSTISLT